MPRPGRHRERPHKIKIPKVWWHNTTKAGDTAKCCRSRNRVLNIMLFSTRILFKDWLWASWLHDAACVTEAWSDMCHVLYLDGCRYAQNFWIRLVLPSTDGSQVLARNADFDIDSWKKAGAWEPWLMTLFECFQPTCKKSGFTHPLSANFMFALLCGVNGSMQLSHVVTASCLGLRKLHKFKSDELVGAFLQLFNSFQVCENYPHSL